jgi:hypothetical protein
LSAVSSPCNGCGRSANAGRILHVRCEEDLARLSRSWSRYDRIQLLTDEFDSAERTMWERRLLAHYEDCGCDAGAVAVLLALSAFVAVAIALPGERTWTTIGLGIAATFAAALIGKLAGVVVARILLRRDIRDVRARLGTSSRSG